MGKSGPRPKGKVKIEWSADFAYAIGLIVTDGCLSRDGRHINFTSKDYEQIENFQRSLGIKMHVGMKSRGGQLGKEYFVIQIGDVLFHKFLVSIGITPAKSKTIGEIRVPDEYFSDYLRGCFDGDGCIYSYWDRRWKSSYMFYVCFASASEKHIFWLQDKIQKHIRVKGHITKAKNDSTYQLRYAKEESLKVLSEMYKNRSSISLSRKRLKVARILAIVGKFI